MKAEDWKTGPVTTVGAKNVLRRFSKAGTVWYGVGVTDFDPTILTHWMEIVPPRLPEDLEIEQKLAKALDERDHMKKKYDELWFSMDSAREQLAALRSSEARAQEALAAIRKLAQGW